MKRVPILLLALAFPACMVTRTSGVSGSRPAIRFENVAAAQTFYEAVIDEQFPAGAGRSLTFKLAPLDLRNESVRDGGAILAEAMPRADRDGDGTITAFEARDFAR